MADNSRVIRMDPDDPEKVLTNTESHIETAMKPQEDPGELDFWRNQDFTLVSEAEEAENRILSPDSESVLKNAAQSDKGNTLRGSRGSLNADRTLPQDKSDTITETRDGLEARKALSRQQQQRIGRATEERAPSDKSTASSKTVLGVKKITPPSRSNAPVKKTSDTMTAAGVKRIPQTPERTKAAKASRIRTYKKERAAKVRKVIINIICWILVIGLCIGAFMLGYRLFNDIPVDQEDISKITVSISGLENDEEMADFLEEYDLINDKFMYKLRCKVYDADYKEGTYKLSRSYTTEKIINILSGFKAYADGTMEED